MVLEVNGLKFRRWQGCTASEVSLSCFAYEAFGVAMHSLACGRIIAVSASILTWPSALCVSLSSFYKDSSHMGLKIQPAHGRLSRNL